MTRRSGGHSNGRMERKQISTTRSDDDQHQPNRVSAHRMRRDSCVSRPIPAHEVDPTVEVHREVEARSHCWIHIVAARRCSGRGVIVTHSASVHRPRHEFHQRSAPHCCTASAVHVTASPVVETTSVDHIPSHLISSHRERATDRPLCLDSARRPSHESDRRAPHRITAQRPAPRGRSSSIPATSSSAGRLNASGSNEYGRQAIPTGEDAVR
jgi:hypothetical protein